LMGFLNIEHRSSHKIVGVQKYSRIERADIEFVFLPVIAEVS